MPKINQFSFILTAALSLYLLGYVIARATIFHRVERYAGQEILGVDAKGNPRQDYVAKRDQPPGKGWEYQLFMPVIKVEESVVNFLN